ncbi:hypothetical protein CHE218_09910 [Microbacterium sp. che218]
MDGSRHVSLSFWGVPGSVMPPSQGKSGAPTPIALGTGHHCALPSAGRPLPCHPRGYDGGGRSLSLSKGPGPERKVPEPVEVTGTRAEGP